jgi:hypothetical protein
MKMNEDALIEVEQEEDEAITEGSQESVASTSYTYIRTLTNKPSGSVFAQHFTLDGLDSGSWVICFSSFSVMHIAWCGT